MKNRIFYITVSIVLLVGVSLVLYPTISDYWNQHHQTQLIATYSEDIENLDEDEYEEILQDARDYNESLASNPVDFTLSDNQKAMYNDLLNVSGNGIMGYVEIPSINCTAPIYHGTDESVLQIAIGHLEWTSLPVGGKNTHCVISGHRGLPSARLFTDVNKLSEGDVFILRVLDEPIAYEIDQILIVEPENTKPLEIVEGMDYCTLMTCTPYGVNTHRLLLRGHRISYADAEEILVVADANQINPQIVALIIGFPMYIIVMFLVLIFSGKNRKNKVK